MTQRKSAVRKASEWARVQSVQCEVEAAMRSLPLPSWPATDKEGKKFRITYSHDIRAPNIEHLAEKYPAMLSDMLSVPIPSPSRKDVEAQFAMIEKRARGLRKSLTDLSRSRHTCAAIQTAMNDPTWTPYSILEQLEALIVAAGHAQVPTAKSKKGPANDGQGLKIAKAAWEDYKELTGKPFSRTRNAGGGYPAFLQKILAALGRTDSAENLAKTLRLEK